MAGGVSLISGLFLVATATPTRVYTCDIRAYILYPGLFPTPNENSVAISMDEEGLHGLDIGRWNLQEPGNHMMDESEYESLPTENYRVHLIAGGFAGVMEHCVMYPVDLVKVVLPKQRGHIYIYT